MSSTLLLANKLPIVFKENMKTNAQIIPFTTLLDTLFWMFFDLTKSVTIKKILINIETDSKTLISFKELILPDQTIS